MNEIWPSIQIIFEQKDLIGLVSDAIEKSNKDLVGMPETTNHIIIFLNSNHRFELEALGVEDRTTIL